MSAARARCHHRADLRTVSHCRTPRRAGARATHNEKTSRLHSAHAQWPVRRCARKRIYAAQSGFSSMPTQLPWEDAGVPLAYGVGGSVSLPPELARRRLPLSRAGSRPKGKSTAASRGRRANISARLHDRFVPQNDEELAASIFTWWELLDRMMAAHSPGPHQANDHIQETLLRRLLLLVRAPNVTHYCEVGMNGGRTRRRPNQ